jgi:hypothetical protein
MWARKMARNQSKANLDFPLHYVDHGRGALYFPLTPTPNFSGRLPVTFVWPVRMGIAYAGVGSGYLYLVVSSILQHPRCGATVRPSFPSRLKKTINHQFDD